MYRCEICRVNVHPVGKNGHRFPAHKIKVLYTEGPNTGNIKKELKVCASCKQAHDNGVPLESLFSAQPPPPPPLNPPATPDAEGFFNVPLRPRRDPNKPPKEKWRPYPLQS